MASSFLAVMLRVRHIVVEREGVARQQVPDIVPDGEPHLTLNNTRPQREWVRVRLENRPRTSACQDSRRLLNAEGRLSRDSRREGIRRARNPGTGSGYDPLMTATP